MIAENLDVSAIIMGDYHTFQGVEVDYLISSLHPVPIDTLGLTIITQNQEALNVDIEKLGNNPKLSKLTVERGSFVNLTFNLPLSSRLRINKLRVSIPDKRSHKSSKIYLEISIPRYFRGHNFYQLTVREFYQTIELLENDLKSMGIYHPIEDFTISRIDLFRNIKKTFPSAYYRTLIKNVAESSIFQQFLFGTTVYYKHPRAKFGEGSQPQELFAFYEKKPEMQKDKKYKDLDTSEFPEVIRMEYRLRGREKIKQRLGFGNLQEFCVLYATLDSKLRSYFQEKVFGNNATIDYSTGSRKFEDYISDMVSSGKLTAEQALSLFQFYCMMQHEEATSNTIIDILKQRLGKNRYRLQNKLDAAKTTLKPFLLKENDRARLSDMTNDILSCLATLPHEHLNANNLLEIFPIPGMVVYDGRITFAD